MRSSFDHFNGLSEIAQFVSEAKIAEQVMSTSSNLAVFQCRSSLEHAINWMYSIDKDLSIPEDNTIFGLITNLELHDACPSAIIDRMHIIRKVGNRAVHETGIATEEAATLCIEYLFDVFDYIGFSYFPSYVRAQYSLPTEEETFSSQTQEATTLSACHEKTSKSFSETPIAVSSKMVNSLYGKQVCNNSFTKSQLEELLRYLDEGDKNFTTEQNECVKYPGSSDLLIKGTAGSGKSIILMQRAIDLRIRDMNKGYDSRIAILTYTNSLVTALKMTVSAATHCDAIDIRTLDSLAYNMYKSLKHKSPDFLHNRSEEEQLGFIKKAVSLFTKNKKSRIAEMSPEFLSDEFQWIKGMGFKTLADYKRSGRAGRGSQVKMTESDYSAAYDLYTLYVQTVRKAGLTDRLDLFEEINQLPEIALTKYTYILVDEAQDLPPVILRFAKRLAEKSITIAFDSAQKIYSSAFSLKELGIEVRGRASKTLNRSFRNTLEISKFANGLLREIKKKDINDESSFVQPEFLGRSGKLPAIQKCASPEGQKLAVIKAIKDLLANETGTIGLLYRGENEKIKLKSWMKNAGINYKLITRKKLSEPIQERVRLCSLHSAKGLEFEIVIIPFFQEGIFPSEKALQALPDVDKETGINTERKLLFVGITRAREEVYLFFSGDPSRFLQEFDKQTYVMK